MTVTGNSALAGLLKMADKASFDQNKFLEVFREIIRKYGEESPNVQVVNELSDSRAEALNWMMG